MKKLDKIDLSKYYEGYIWMSNQEKPIVIDINKSLESQIPSLVEINPFIVEGMLTDTVDNSYMIKYVDGECLVNSYSLNNKAKYEPICYDAHRLGGIKKLYFRQYWREKEDPLCENMPVLQASEMVFVGFNPEKK